MGSPAEGGDAGASDPGPVATYLPVHMAPPEISEVDPRQSYDQPKAASGISTDPGPVASYPPVPQAPPAISEAADPRQSYDQPMAASGIPKVATPVRSVASAAKRPPPKAVGRQGGMSSCVVAAGLLAVTASLLAGVFVLFPKTIPFDTPQVSIRWCYMYGMSWHLVHIQECA